MTVTIQKTSKAIKANMLISAFMAVGSLWNLFGDPGNPIYAWSFVFGVAWHVGSRLWRWWKHG